MATPDRFRPRGAASVHAGVLIAALSLVAVACAPRIAWAAPASHASITVAAPLASIAAWYDKVWSRIEASIRTGSGAIQFVMIGMFIALFIIWWRK